MVAEATSGYVYAAETKRNKDKNNANPREHKKEQESSRQYIPFFCFAGTKKTPKLMEKKNSTLVVWKMEILGV